MVQSISSIVGNKRGHDVRGEIEVHWSRIERWSVSELRVEVWWAEERCEHAGGRRGAPGTRGASGTSWNYEPL